MLLSGTDSHLAGLGTIAANFASPSQRGVPGYEGVLNNRVVTFAKLLQDNGYRSYWLRGRAGRLSAWSNSFSSIRSAHWGRDCLGARRRRCPFLLADSHPLVAPRRIWA